VGLYSGTTTVFAHFASLSTHCSLLAARCSRIKRRQASD